MNFITGTFVIHAPASALNNGKGENNLAQVKTIRVRQHEYPYVSAQALRYWLRETIARHDPDWQAAPVYRAKGGKQQAYTEGDPLTYWDDDLFGYMRAEKSGTLTRVAPFRLSTAVSAAPVEIVEDFGVMGRGDGDFVLHGHEFYHALLVGSFSIDLASVGTFSYQDRSGYRNLSTDLIKQAEAGGLEHLPGQRSYRLPLDQRMQRVAGLLRAFGRLEGGAKQTLHYTDVAPALVVTAVLRGGNNPFMYLVDAKPYAVVRDDVLDEAFTAYQGDFLSPLYVGIRRGFADAALPMLAERQITVMHPRQAFDALADDLWQHPEWFD